MPDYLVPRRVALASSDEELRQAAEYRPDDIALALAWLELYAPELARMVILGEPFEREHLPLSYMAGLLAGGTRYLYLTQRGLFFDLRRRRAVPPPEVRELLDRALSRAGRDARAQMLALRNRTLDLPRWEIGMRQQVKSATAGAVFTANGGPKRTHLEALGRMQQTVYEQFVFLSRFAQQIESGQQPMDGRALTRSEAYIENARAAHMEARREVAQSVGYDQERSLLNPADHCDLCVEEAEKGWQPLGEMVPIGKRTCLWNCRCNVAYRNSQTGETEGDAGREILEAA